MIRFLQSHQKSHAMITGALVGSMSLACLVGSTGCSSSVTIHSKPSGARAFVDGKLIGTTPCTYSDAAVVGSSRKVKLELDGYETFQGKFSRTGEANVGAIIGGILVLVPFLWTLDYPDEVYYELEPVAHGG